MRFRSTGGLAFGAALFLGTAPALAASVPGAPSGRGGSLLLDREALVAYVADSDNAALHRVDLSSGDVVTTPLTCPADRAGDAARPVMPQELAWVSPGRLAVTLRGCDAVALVDVAPSGEAMVTASAFVPAEPWGLAVTPTGEILVTSAWGRAVTALAIDASEADGETLRVRYSLPVPREPRGVSVSPDGAKAIVTHAAGQAITVVSLVGSGAAEGPTVRQIQDPFGHQKNAVDKVAGAGTLHETGSLAYTAVWNDAGTRLFVPHLLVQNSKGTTQTIASGYGGVSIEQDATVASVAVIAARTETPLVAREPAQEKKGAAVQSPPRRVLLHTDFQGSPAIAPSGAPSRQARAAAVLGNSLFVASMGTNEIVELDANALDPAMTVRRRIAVGEGPTGLDVDPGTGIAVVWNQLSHDIAIVSLGSGAVERLPVSEDPLSADMALGRRLFHGESTRKISRDGRACAGCHPEGRHDGLVWSLGNGPRKTLMLAGRLDHGPYGWHGEHADLGENIQETIRRLGGSGLDRQEITALAAYVQKGLVPPPAPRPSPAEAQLVLRGKALFTSNEVGCVWCHKLEQEGSDRSLHDVASRAKGDDRPGFRTPPLKFVLGAGPYFHDGRYATLDAVVDENLDRMGNTTTLSREDRNALVAFLRSL